MHLLKVLILEDHPFQLMALHQMLNANGVFDVLAAESAECAMEMLARRGPVDIAICDLCMDGDGGQALIRHLAEQRLARALVVLSDAGPALLTHVGDLASQWGLRVLGSVSKPASNAVLHQLLRDYCEAPSQPQAGISPQIVELTRLGTEQLASARAQWRVQYQPRLCAEGQVVGVEASVQWQHPTLGVLEPGRFYTLEKGAGLLEQLTWHVLENAVALSASQYSPLPVAVALPPSLLPDGAFCTRLVELLAQQALPPGLLTLELHYSQYRRLTEGQWRALRHSGCRLSLDGFDGQASLPHLIELPLHELKLSAQRLRDMAGDGTKLAEVTVAMIFARRRDLRVLVTGVDTLFDWHALQSLGAPVAQGAFISGPLVAEALSSWLDAHVPATLARK